MTGRCVAGGPRLPQMRDSGGRHALTAGLSVESASRAPRRRRADPIPTRGTWRCSPSDQARPSRPSAGTNVSPGMSRVVPCLAEFNRGCRRSSGHGADPEGHSEAEHGDQAGGRPAVLVRFGDHRVREHGEQGARGEGLTSATVPPLASPNRGSPAPRRCPRPASSPSTEPSTATAGRRSSAVRWLPPWIRGGSTGTRRRGLPS